MDEARALGDYVGSADAQELARDANRHRPELRTHDRYGHRIDLVEYHPAYHALMAQAFGTGVHSRGVDGAERGGSPRARCCSTSGTCWSRARPAP